MKASVPVNVRIPVSQYRLIRRAAKSLGIAVATFVREQAYLRAAMLLDNEPDPITTEANK